MEPKPHRRRAKTVTRNTVKWKIRDDVDPMTGVLAEEDIERIAASYAIDPALLRALSRKLRGTFSSTFNFSQPELVQGRKEAGKKRLARANDQIRSAQTKLSEASKQLQDVRFSDPYAHIGRPNPFETQIDDFESLLASLKELAEFFSIMERSDLARYQGTADARKVSDVRRMLVCINLFGLWDDLDRKLSFTTDPSTSKRTGLLFEFVNDVVLCLTDPPERLSGEAIKRELDGFHT